MICKQFEVLSVIFEKFSAKFYRQCNPFRKTIKKTRFSETYKVCPIRKTKNEYFTFNQILLMSDQSERSRFQKLRSIQDYAKAFNYIEVQQKQENSGSYTSTLRTAKNKA